MSLIREFITKRFTRSNKWPGVRKKFLEKHADCACCSSKKSLEVHHKKPFHGNPELELDENNLITLCDGSMRCHLLVGHLGDWKSWNTEAQVDADQWLGKIKNRPTDKK